MINLARFLMILLFGLGLAACGAAAPPPPAPRTAAPSAEATTPPSAAASAIGELATSTTAEGYQVLGDPNAPVTLVMYSDFL